MEEPPTYSVADNVIRLSKRNITTFKDIIAPGGERTEGGNGASAFISTTY
jgi:hypothetical protein